MFEYSIDLDKNMFHLTYSICAYQMEHNSFKVQSCIEMFTSNDLYTLFFQNLADLGVGCPDNSRNAFL